MVDSFDQAKKQISEIKPQAQASRSQTLVSADLKKQLNFIINNNNNTNLYSANGGRMTALGSSHIAIVSKTGTVFSKALVTSNLAHPVLLS